MKYGSFRLPVFVLLVFLACSCSTEGNIQRILGTTVESPVFLDCRPLSSTELAFRFSRPVRVVSLDFDTDVETGAVAEGREVKVTFARPLEEGGKFTADIVVEDDNKNTLNVIVPFRARNDRLPAIVFNEFRTENTKPKAEFVEFLTPEAGNLGALRLFIAGYSLSKPVYEFPPAEVKAGEYIVLHLRTTEEGCADETGTDLALSGGTDASGSARDFWLPGNTELLRKSDALWLLDQDDRIVDAVLLSEKPDGEWDKKYMPQAADYIGRNNAWIVEDGENTRIPGPADTVFSGYTTNTRTVCRDENLLPERRAGNWYITATSGATPGKPNNPKRYQ